MNSEKTYTAVVAGHDHQNTLGIIRSLGEAGCSVKAVILFDGEVCSTAHSKHLNEAVIVRPSELIDTLVRIGAQLKEKAALIPCGDDTAAAIDQAHTRLAALYHLPHAGLGGNMLRLMNKKEMLEVAQAAGLNVPRWVSIQQDRFSELEQLCSSLTFPCILKPIILSPDGVFEFRILQSMAELLDSLDYITQNCTSIIIQEYVRKTKEYGVNGCRLYRSGGTIFGGIIEKKRFSQASLGSTTAGTILPDAHGLCDAVKRFVEFINYRGIFDVEFITDGNEFYFVEINFRNGGYGYAYTKAGRNYPAIWTTEAYGGSIELYLRKPLQTIFFINESADLKNVRAGSISVFTWLRDVLLAEAHMYINIRDMKPLLKKIMRK